MSEIFTFITERYDVELAQWLIDNGHLDARLMALPLASYAGQMFAIDRNVPLVEQTKQSLWIRMDYKHAAAMTPERLMEPGLLVFRDVSYLLIDGNHRAARLYHEGAETMTVHAIANAQRQQIMVGGKGYAKARDKMMKARKS